MVSKITESEIIKLFLSDYSRRLYLRELAAELKKPHQSVKPYAEKLTEKKVLSKTERKNLIEYSLNFKNKAVYDYLTIAEKQKTQEHLKDLLLKTLYEKLTVHFNKNTFLVFGSAAENMQKARDIDLLAIGKENIKKAIEGFEAVYSKKIHLVQVKDLKSLNLTFAKEIYKKHLILNNTELIIRFFGELYEANKLV